MKIKLDVPNYSPQQGFRIEYEDEYTIEAQIKDGVAIVKADYGGLVTLARSLLTLAQSSVPVGYYANLDEWSGLEAGSCRISFVKREEAPGTTGRGS